MYVKSFFERMWDSEQRNELFVCMPFHNSLDDKFNKIIKIAAKKAGFDDATRVKENIISDIITTKIFDGIANSKMLLFDLSDDPKSPCEISKQINGNVLYELGIANSFREPQDIVLIRERKSNKLPFDISGMTYIEYDDEDSKLLDKLTNILKELLTQQEWAKSKRMKSVIKSLNELAIELMYSIGRNPDEWRHFSTIDMPIELKDTVARLVDLGILEFACKCDGNYREYAYHWTLFGCEVMKSLNIQRLSKEEFEKSPNFEKHNNDRKKYQKDKENYYASIENK